MNSDGSPALRLTSPEPETRYSALDRQRLTRDRLAQSLSVSGQLCSAIVVEKSFNDHCESQEVEAVKQNYVSLSVILVTSTWQCISIMIMNELVKAIKANY